MENKQVSQIHSDYPLEKIILALAQRLFANLSAMQENSKKFFRQ
jgi:hypothetical protein